MNTTEYHPQTLEEFVFGNNESRELINYIVGGGLPFPFSGTTGILLYGTFGTGKTTLARLMPELIEMGKTNQSLAWPAEFFGCQQGHSGTVITDMVKKQNNILSFNASQHHYFIFDEVDSLSKPAQSSLKTTLNSNMAIFILTTNNISQLDRGIKDRCLLVEMNAAIDAEYLPLARRIASDKGVVLSDTQLLTAIEGHNGSFRTIIFSLLRLILHTTRLSSAAASIAATTIQQAAGKK